CRLAGRCAHRDPCSLRNLLAHALELGGALELLLALRTARGGTRRRGRRVLRLAHGAEAKDAIHQLQIALDLEQRLRRPAVLEEYVERAPLLRDEICELARSPVLHLADGAALILDQLL